MMTTRIMLSLKKVAAPSSSAWGLSRAEQESMRFARGILTGRGDSDISLGDMPSEGRIGPSQSHGQN